MLNTTINERYRIDAEIGQGGMGVVYRAHDLVLERDVAVKELSNYKLGTEGKAQLLAEAKTVAQLNHPHIVSVFDAGEHDGTPFIVMEYVEGQTLRENMPQSWDDILEVTRQICSSLEHAHNHDVIHRDLKPENVVIDLDGNTKLMDFGIAHSLSSRITSDGMIIGTVFYMSPEQAMGRSVDARSDLYSLGVMLYEFSTGDVPFSDMDAIAVISQHINAPIVPPRAKRSDIPPGIESLIMALLEKEPDDRPDSATVVLKTLNDSLFLDTDAIPTRDLTLLDRIVRGRMIGRKPELDQARKLWKKSSEGKGQSLLISGEPGIGKTRLVKEIVTLTEVAGGQAFIGESYAEGGVPYDAFTQIVRQVLKLYEGKQLELPDFVLADLIELSPELKPYYPDIEPNPELEPEAHQRRLFENMVAFCEKLSEIKPLLIVVDDAHWSDSGTLHMLHHLMRRTRDLPIMLIATYREVELDDAKPFHEVMLDLNRERLGARIKLSRLEREQTDKLLNVIFDDDVTPEFLEGIHKETEGNPFFIEEVCKALVESGKLYYQDGEWHHPDDMKDLEIPQGVKVAIQYRVNKLPDSSKDAMVAAAVIGREFDFATLLKVTESDEDALIDAIEDAVRAQLIDELRNKGGEKFSFSHALIPAALRDTLGGLRRIRMHRRVAAAIHELHPEEHELLAYHFSEAGDDEQSFAFTIKAAERAKDSYANNEAIRFYSEALNTLPSDDPRKFDLLSKRAAVYNTLAMRDPQSEDLLEMLALAKSLKDNSLVVRSLIALSNYSLSVDQYNQQKEYSKKAYDLAQDLEDPQLVAESYLEYGIVFSASAQFSACLELLTQAKEILQNSEPSFLSARLSKATGSALLGLRKLDAALEEGLKALKISRSLNSPFWEAESLIVISQAHWLMKNYDQALTYEQQSIHIYRQIGDKQGEFHTNWRLGWRHRLLGNNQKMLEHYQNCLDVVWELGEPTAVISILYVYSLAQYLYPGEIEAGLEFLAEQILVAERTGDSYSVFAARYVLAKIQSLIGLYQTAFDTFENVFIEALEWTDLEREFAQEMGHCKMKLGHFEQSRSIMSSVFEKFLEVTESPKAIADMLTYLSKLDLLEADEATYSTALDRVLQAIQKYENAGNDSTLDYCTALNIAATLQLALGQEKDAQDLTTKLVEIIEKTFIPIIAPHYFTHSLALRANNNTDEADSYLKRAYDRVTSVGNKIKARDVKTAWLETNRENREIVAAYQDWGEKDDS